jgi:curved DNA-binding protein CbpA
VTHYEVLGVRRDATAAEIRRAYVSLARAHHPDRHVDSNRAERDVSERRMQTINAAWRELGDPDRRRRYDEMLDIGIRDAFVEEEGPRTWRPFDGGWDLDPDDLEDRFGEADARRPTAGRLLALLPVASFTLGVAALVIGILVDLRPIIALGFAGIALSVVFFVAAPVAIVLESRRHDRL